MTDRTDALKRWLPYETRILWAADCVEAGCRVIGNDLPNVLDRFLAIINQVRMTAILVDKPIPRPDYTRAREGQTVYEIAILDALNYLCDSLIEPVRRNTGADNRYAYAAAEASAVAVNTRSLEQAKTQASSGFGFSAFDIERAWQWKLMCWYNDESSNKGDFPGWPEPLPWHERSYDPELVNPAHASPYR